MRPCTLAPKGSSQLSSRGSLWGFWPLQEVGVRLEEGGKTVGRVPGRVSSQNEGSSAAVAFYKM